MTTREDTTGDPHSILRRKSIAQMDEEAEESGLVKSLGLWQLTAIGVGGIIGIGIFTSPASLPAARTVGVAPGRR